MPEDELRDFVRVRYLDLLRIAYLLTGSWPGAEDLVQSVLVKTMGRWSKIDDPMAYLRRAMVNQQSSVWRRLRGEVLTARLPDRSTVGDLSEEAAQRDELMRALAKLPPRTRAVVVLRYWEDLSEAETAEVLGCSVGAVKSQGSRGLAQLRGVLRPGKAVVGGPSDDR